MPTTDIVIKDDQGKPIAGIQVDLEKFIVTLVAELAACGENVPGAQPVTGTLLTETALRASGSTLSSRTNC